MQTLSNDQELQLVSGGFGAYDVGNEVGSALRSCFFTFVAMGSLYVATT